MLLDGERRGKRTEGREESREIGYIVGWPGKHLFGRASGRSYSVDGDAALIQQEERD